MDNPNEYDDGVYTEVLMELEDEVGGLVERLWKAGASVDDIRNEFASSLNNGIAEVTGQSTYVSGGPKKPKAKKS